MSRYVFFSFHYENDINRSMIVRNSWITQDRTAAGFIDKADFESIKRCGNEAVHKWIDNQLVGTSVTVVLIGSETLKRPFVQYEICSSLKRGNAVIGVHISGVKDMITSQIESKENTHTIIGYYDDGTPAYFDIIATGIYDYVNQDGYKNLGLWIESAAQSAGK